MTFSKELEIIQTGVEDKICDLLAILNFTVHCFSPRTVQVNSKGNNSPDREMQQEKRLKLNA